MRRMKIIALVAAVVAGLAIYQFLREISKPQETPRTEVVVAAVNIPENTAITQEMVMLQPVATEALLRNHVLDLESVVGMVMASDVLAGEQIVTDRLVRVGEAEAESNTLAYVVQPGMRAVTVSVGVTTGVGNMLKPGNRVDLVLNYTYQEEPEDREESEGAQEEAAEEKAVNASKLLMQNIEVLAVDAILSKAGAAEGYVSVTLMVTPEQAVELSYAEFTANLRLILRSSLDEEIAEETEVTLDTIRGISEEAD